MLSFAVLSSHNFELDLLFLVHAGVGKVCLSDTLVEHLALLFFFITDTALLVSLEPVDILVLHRHRDVTSNLIFVALGLNFVLDKFVLNNCQLFLVLKTFDVLDSALLLCLDGHLKLKLTSHLFTLLEKSHGLFAVLHLPFCDVCLNLLVPLRGGHADHLALVCSYNLLINVNWNKAFVGGSSRRLLAVGGTGILRRLSHCLVAATFTDTEDNGTDFLIKFAQVALRN